MRLHCLTCWEASYSHCHWDSADEIWQQLTWQNDKYWKGNMKYADWLNVQSVFHFFYSALRYGFINNVRKVMTPVQSISYLDFKRPRNLINHMYTQDASKTYPVTYPKNVTPRCTLTLPSKCHAVTISWAGAWATPGAYVYILNHLHRSGVYLGNQYQLPLMAIAWVTDMPNCGCCHCRCS